MGTNLFADAVIAFTREFGSFIRTDVLLAPFTTYKIGGPADIFFEAKTQDEFVKIIRLAKSLSVPVTLLGGGTNILIGDGGIRGLVVKNLSKGIHVRGVIGGMKSGVESKIVYVEADSGVMLNSLVRYTVEEGLSGLEMHLGLPGTVGGAVYMNSKWMHPVGYIGDRVHSAKILTTNMEVCDVGQEYFHFDYGYSELQKTGDVLLSVVFALPSVDKAVLWDIANSSIEYRRNTQPQGIRSAGCAFKNISKEQARLAHTPNETCSAGFLIDSVGLKGATSGDAMISEHHANFIINKGKATALDVLQLIARAKDQVKARYGVLLEEEIIHLGEF